MYCRLLAFAAWVSIAFATRAAAQTPSRLDFTIVDAPYNVAEGLRGPSMRQALDLSVAAYEVSHAAIEKAFGRRKRLGRAAVALFDIASTVEVALPLTSVWVHEEFHRAVMGRRGVNSFDDVYRLDIDAAWIAVSHVKDDDIVRLKRDHPAEWVRTQSAGIEGELRLVGELERRRFFGQSRAWHLPLYWLTKLGTFGYVASGTWSDADADVDKANRDDGANVKRRDFTGHDLLGWTYDLHRPGEPYTARGIHPSGVGIDRYVKLADLTDEERRYLKRQGRLQLLNFVDPFLFGLNGGIAVGPADSPTRVNAGLSHYLTSFGHTIDANIFVRRGDTKLVVVAHAYANDGAVFPGVEGEWLDVPVAIGSRNLSVSPRLAVWLQPERQQFRTTRADAGGLAALRVRAGLSPRLGMFTDLEAKTAGWVAGAPYLDANATIRVGVSVGQRPRSSP